VAHFPVLRDAAILIPTQIERGVPYPERSEGWVFFRNLEIPGTFSPSIPPLF